MAGLSPNRPEICSLAVKVIHASTEQVFAQLRMLMRRDRDRLGNVMYVKGNNTLVLTDWAGKLRYYAQIVDMLDAEAQVTGESGE